MRCRFTVPCVLLGIVALLPTPTKAAAPRSSIVFILDCSQEMDATMPAEAGIHEVADSAGDSRFDVARDALKAALTELAGQGDHQVAVWLFGHRLAWQGDDRSALVEQAEYLEQTLGFKVLADLLPGDDVELARPLTKLLPADLDPLFVRLAAAKPWGESPLYLAIERALESLNRNASAADTTVVVLTAGLNEQWIAKQASKKERVVGAAERRPVPVHIVALGRGDKPRRQHDAELKQVAAATRGSYLRVDTADAVEEAIAAALRGGHGAAGHDESTATASDTSHVQSVSAPPARLAKHAIEGTLTYGGRAVRRAKVTIEGGAASTAVTDSSG
ncbi:MAG TPA: hypothetical protein VGX76_14140, partial [Pirellulales bacterium]|nr:hypothetical protein [Pirellulales bacterium]